MSERLARAKAFALEAEELFDEVPEHSPRRQLANTRRAALRRPDRLAGDVSGDAMNRSFWYDGKMFSALDKEQNVWASGGVPATVDAALDWVFERTGTVVPLADFLYADSYARLMGSVQRGEYLGIHEAAGVPCHHLAFEQATIDWQLWIDAGKDPLPRKLVITYKTEDEVPQVHGDHPEVESRAAAAGCAVRLHSARRRRPCRGAGVRRPDGAPGWRSAMSRHLTISVTLIALVVGSNPALEAQRSRGSVSHSGNTTSAQGQRASGSRTTSQTSSGGTATRQAQTQSGASRSTTRQVDAENREIDKSTTATTAWGESGTRSREVEGHGGYATVEGSARTSTGRSASGEAVAGRTYYGQPAVAGTVNTKYNGTYSGAAARTPYGGYNTAVAGPYGGRVTTTLPSGYRTSTYYGRSYYTYGGTYYRPYTYGGVHYYYPVPPPYYSYYSYPPPGATILIILGVKYLVSQDGHYCKQTTTSDGKTTYQAVPAPQGAAMPVLPSTRVLVSVTGTTYYLSANAFYRRVMNGAQESFVVVTAPAGVVFVAALPANFEVVQLNTMYFKAGGRYYVPYLSPDGAETYVMVDAPPTPSSTAAVAAPPVQPSAPAAAKAPRRSNATPAAPSGRPCPCGGGAPRGTLRVRSS